MSDIVKQLATEARERPEKFDLSDREARMLSFALAAVTMRGKPDQAEIYQQIKSGSVRMYGIPVSVTS